MTANWTPAAARAAAIAAGWQREAGPGGAVVLFDRDGVREAFAGGLASVEHGLPFTPQTANRFASISKHVLAVALLREGMPLDAPLGRWLPELPAPLAGVELGRALDMTGGLPDMMEAFWQQGVPFTATLSADEIHALACRFPSLSAPPGTEMAYSNTGWRLAQRVLETVTGRPYGETVAALSGELGLAFRLPYDSAEIVPGLATGYWRDGARWRRGHYGFHFSASGGIAGSAADLAGWFSALLAGRGALSGMLERLTAPRRFADGGESVYRLGLVCSRLGGFDVVGHGGSLTGYRNHVLTAPGPGVGVVVLSNREEEALWPALTVLAALLGEPLPAAAEAPAGLFASEEGPFWAELTPDSISFMGGYERLVADGAGGLRSLPAYLDIRLRRDGEDRLAGLIGGVRRALRRVPADTRLDARLLGHWRDPHFGTEIAIRPDGTALWPWPAGGKATRLTPLPGARALADLTHGPWRARPCLWLDGEDRLRVAGHRARVLRLERAG
ncbi:serine hydrolase domain-containing protein [Bosea minatitlanensis]|uniref:Serine hydrolase domain-containing protein n=1 Tax=Bosea minatitlanensis TaxID=128782 RepID=A0ABW0F7S3_9HYPH|nr:serine hydrolase domain-containing protein [Bosea minatitlanensis]MCT4494301.1 beta-lactamase family protein [Bosea minatitlanensis]